MFADLMQDTKGFEKLAAFLKVRAGINLPTTGKNQSLMAGRVGPLLRRHQLASYADLLKCLGQEDSKIEKEFVTSMTTNTTHWFREEEHFKKLTSLLPSFFEKAQRDRQSLRIWCAAASSGQEPYTLAIVVNEAWRSYSKSNSIPPVKILGTDINEKVLQKAAAGIYRDTDMRGLSLEQKAKYFTPHIKSGDKFFMVNSMLSEIVTFAPLNLLDPHFPFRGHFDFIFCRNVFIYFERHLCSEIVEKMSLVQKPGSYLFLGHSEVGTMKCKDYKVAAHAVFERI